jgi:WD40 repeat protein
MLRPWFIAVARSAIVLAWCIGIPSTARAQTSTAKNVARLDQFGERLPDSAVLRIGTSRNRSSGTAQALAFTPDNKHLVSIDLGTGVHVWDVAAGKELAAFGALAGGLAPFALTPDGSLAALVEAKDACRVYETGTGRVICTLDGPWTAARVLALSNDNKLMASLGEDQVVRVWELASGTLLRRWTNTNSESDWRSLRLTFSPDSKKVVFGARNTPIYVVDVASGQQAVIGNGGDCGGGFAFSPDGHVLATVKTQSNHLCLWDLATGKILHTLGQANAPYWCVGFAPDGKTVATGHYPGKVCIWDVAAGKLMHTFSGHPGEVENLAFSPDGKLLALGSGGCTVRIWEADTGRQRHVFAGHHAAAVAARFSSDGKSITTVCNPWYYLKSPTGSTIRLLDATTGLTQGQFEWNPDTTPATCLAADAGVLAVVGKDSRVHVIYLNTSKEPIILAPDVWPIKAVRLSADGRLLAVEASRRSTEPQGLETSVIQVWDIAAAKVAFALHGVPGEELTGRFTDDGRLLAVHSRRYQFVESTNVIGMARSNLQPLLPDSSTLTLYDARTGIRAIRAGLPIPLDALGAFSPSGRLMASPGAGEEMVIRELITGKTVLSLGVAGKCSAVAFAPDGATIALGTHEGRILLWDVVSQTNLVTMVAGHQGSVLSVNFSPDGKRLVSSASDTTLLVWDVERWTRRAAKEVPLAPGEAVRLWKEMAGADAALAYDSFMRFARTPHQAVAFLRGQLRPVRAEQLKEIAPAIAVLDSDRYAAREVATFKLQALGALAVPALERVLASQPSLEARRRVELLLSKIEHQALSGEWLQTWRALEMLEMLGGDDALQLLQTLAGGERDAWLTQEAAAGLERLTKRGR